MDKATLMMSNVRRVFDKADKGKGEHCTIETRIHSSRMRTGRSLAVLGGVPGPGVGGVPGPRVGGVPGPGGVYLVPGDVPGPGGCTWSWGGVPSPGDVPGPGGCTWSGGVYLVPRRCTWSRAEE